MLLTKKEIAKTIAENKQRLQQLFAPYNPVTGEGSFSVPRFAFNIKADGSEVLHVPKSMLSDPLTWNAVQSGSLEKLVRRGCAMRDIPYSEHLLIQLKADFMQTRLDHDFEYWAFTSVKITDKDTGQPIPFLLNRPQRILLKDFERQRLENIPIRTIITKARQWGGSTLTQMYFAWIQNRLKTGWGSVIVAHVNNQARNIRNMYSKFAKSYPSQLGEVTIQPYEGSPTTRIIKERDCIMDITSIESPESTRSFDYALCHLCIHPETLIPTKDGFLKKANELIIGDAILTHNGNHSEITAISSNKPSILNGNGKAVSVKTWGGTDVILTPNHPVYTKNGWVNAGRIKKDDWVSLPVRTITNNITHITLPFLKKRPQGGGRLSSAEGAIINLTEEFGFFVGYYLAEGSVHLRKNNRAAEIVFVRHDNEAAFADRAINSVRDLISSTSRSNKLNTKRTDDTVYCNPLSTWVYENLGAKEYKRIPDWFFDCGREFLSGVLQGYLCGDGSKDNGKQGNYVLAQIFATTISSSIATQIRDIAASLNLGWASIDVKEAGIYHKRNCKKSYNVRWHGSSARNIRRLLGWEVPNNGHKFSEKSYIQDDKVWIRVKKVESTNVDFVYDIAVKDEDHSFRTLNFSVKNSEVGLWRGTLLKKPEDMVQNLRAGVKKVPLSMVVLESTAKGVGNFFHREWLDAKSGKSSYSAVFIPWHAHNKYITKMLEEDYERFIMDMSMDDWERWFQGATLEGILWYNSLMKAENYDKWRMESEYPGDDEEAFQSTGNTIFHRKFLSKMEQFCRHPEHKGELTADAEKGKYAFNNIRFEEKPGGNLWIWAKPDKDILVKNRYVVSVDIGGTTEGADWSVIRVIDRYPILEGGVPETVATWRGHIDQDLLAWIAVQIAEWYNHALVVVESNSLAKEIVAAEGDHFLTVLDEIAEFYDNLYYRTSPEKIREGAPVLWGFHTNRQTKQLVIDNYKAVIRDMEYMETDARVIAELKSYQRFDDGTMGAVEGMHDDMVMSTGIGLYVSESFMSPPVVYTPQSKQQRKAKTKRKGKTITEATI